MFRSVAVGDNDSEFMHLLLHVALDRAAEPQRIARLQQIGECQPAKNRLR
jgi:hypothetical protein